MSKFEKCYKNLYKINFFCFLVLLFYFFFLIILFTESILWKKLIFNLLQFLWKHNSVYMHIDFNLNNLQV